VLAVVILVVDQLTKNWAVASLPELDPQPFLGEFLQFTLLYNSGAAWGMGAEITPVVTCLQIAIVIGVIVFAVRSVRSPWYALALGLIMGGAILVIALGLFGLDADPGRAAEAASEKTRAEAETEPEQ
jgi:signal peptidase II